MDTLACGDTNEVTGDIPDLASGELREELRNTTNCVREGQGLLEWASGSLEESQRGNAVLRARTGSGDVRRDWFMNV